MQTPQTPEMIEHMLQELQRPAKTLTDWELGFLSSISTQWERRQSLSPKQFQILEKIYAEKTT